MADWIIKIKLIINEDLSHEFERAYDESRGEDRIQIGLHYHRKIASRRYLSNAFLYVR